MRSLNIINIESWVAASAMAVAIAIVLFFLINIVWSFNTEVDLQNADAVQLRTISASQRRMIDDWVEREGVKIPDGKGYRYIISTWPNKPWMSDE